MEQKMRKDQGVYLYNGWQEEAVEQTAFSMLEQNHIRGLYPFRFVRRENEKYFRYDAGEGVLLEQWLDKVHGRKDVFALLESILVIEEELEVYLLEEKHLYTEAEYIMVLGNECCMAYIPLKNYGQGNLLQICRYIAGEVRYAWDEDYTYLFDLQNAFSRGDIQNTGELKLWIREMKSREAVADTENRAETAEAVVPEFLVSEAGTAPKNTDDKKKGFLFGSRKKTKDGKQGTEAAAAYRNVESEQQRGKPEKIYFGQMEDRQEEGTVLMQEEQRYELIRTMTGEKYPLDTESCLIGSDRGSAAIHISDNSSISRRHARCLRVGSSFYIEDLDSTNGTFLNGERISTGQKYPLHDGTKVCLSNEEFIFAIRRR